MGVDSVSVAMEEEPVAMTVEEMNSEIDAANQRDTDATTIVAETDEDFAKERDDWEVQKEEARKAELAAQRNKDSKSGEGDFFEENETTVIICAGVLGFFLVTCLLSRFCRSNNKNEKLNDVVRANEAGTRPSKQVGPGGKYDPEGYSRNNQNIV